MKVNDLVEKYGLKPLNIAENSEIKAGYCGDLLSVVISKSPEKAVWFTVMNNVNVSAVATLAEISAVVICDVEDINPTLIQKAIENNINLLTSNKDVFTTCRMIGEL